MGRGKRAKKVSCKLDVSEEDRQKEAARMEKKLAKLKSATVIQEPKQVSLKAGSSVKQTGGIQASSNKTGKTTVPVQQPLKMVLFVFVFFYLCDISSCIALFLLHFIIFLLYCCIVEKEKEVSSSVESNQPSRSNKKAAATKSPDPPPPTPATVEPGK